MAADPFDHHFGQVFGTIAVKGQKARLQKGLK